MSLKNISVEIKNILAGRPSRRGENLIESILGSELSQDIDPDTYFNLIPEGKIEVLTSLYSRTINSFDEKRINELSFISSVLNRCELEISVEGIKRLEEVYRNSKGHFSVQDGIEVVKKYAKTLVEQKFIIRGVEFPTSSLPPYKYEEKLSMGVDFELDFGALANNRYLKEIFRGVSGNLKIINKESKLEIFQNPIDNENDFFYIEVNSCRLTKGDYFFISRFIFLKIDKMLEGEITVSSTSSDGNTRTLSFRHNFSIGSTQSDNIYYANLGGSTTRIYRDRNEWYICNDTVRYPLMMAFHNIENSNHNSRKIGLAKGQSRKVMIEGNIFQFIVE